MLRILAVLALTAFGSALAAGGAQAEDNVTVATGWLPQADFGGFFQAQQDGIYKKHGLNVTINANATQMSTIQLLAAGAADFVRLPSSSVALNMVKQDLPYVVIAAFYQKDPQVIMTHEEMGYKDLSELKGKPIMIAQEARTNFWKFLQVKYGFTADQVRPYSFSGAPFLADPKAIQQGYLTNDVLRMKERGYKVKYFLLADYGYSGYATLIATSKKMVQEHPDVVQRFINASIEGWYAYLYGDRTAVNAMIAAKNPNFPVAHSEGAVAVIKEDKLIEGGDAQTLGIGAMTDARWKNVFDMYAEAGVYPKDMDYRAAYTTQFVDKGYGLRK